MQLEEVAALHVETYWEGIEVPLGIVAIEWAERLQYKPHNYLRVLIHYSSDGGRQVDLVPVGGFDVEAIALLR